MHLNLKKDTRSIIAIILVSLAIIFQIIYFACAVSEFGTEQYKIVVFVINIVIVGMLLFALIKKNTRPLFVTYIIVKTMDGVCNPLVSFIKIEDYSSTSQYVVGKAITFLIAAVALFLSIIFLVICEYNSFKHAHLILEILTLISIAAMLVNLVYTALMVYYHPNLYFEIFEVLFDLFLFTSLYFISPLVHEGESHKKVKEEEKQ